MTHPESSPHSAESEANLAPVQQVPCSQCNAEPGEECGGPGAGWHLSRWDRLHDIAEGVIEA